MTRQKEKSFVFWCLVFLSAAVIGLSVFILAGEAMLRLSNHLPVQPYDPFVDSNGERIIRDDPYLGYTHCPGPVAYPGKVMTHLDNTLRITRPLEAYQDPDARPKIWLFGCSITHGCGLNDEDTFAWKLQERLPEQEIVNFGVEGYSTTQSLLQLKRALEEEGPPAAATLIYGDFHDERSVLSRNWWKDNRKLWEYVTSPQPYACLDGEGRLQLGYLEDPYRLFPLARISALANFTDECYTIWHDRATDQASVGRALVAEFAETCRRAGVPFVLSCWILPDTEVPLLDFCQERGIRTAKVASPSTPEYQNPMDGHPNAKATDLVADHLEGCLRPLLEGS